MQIRVELRSLTCLSAGGKVVGDEYRDLQNMLSNIGNARLTRRSLLKYAAVCAETLARAHARSGDPIAIATYLGDGDAFDRSVTDFGERYAEQNERDFRAFTEAIGSGRLNAIEGL